MEAAKAIIDFLRNLFSWWFTVQPWEQAVFVRAGKHVKVINKGLYLKIPFLDKVFVQSNRIRMVDSSMQNLTTKDGQSIATKSALSYRIGDLFALYNNLFHPETTLTGKMMSTIAEFVSGRDVADINQKELQQHVQQALSSFSQYGLAEIEVHVLCFSKVKTSRLIQDGSYLYKGEDLNMDKPADNK